MYVFHIDYRNRIEKNADFIFAVTYIWFSTLDFKIQS